MRVALVQMNPTVGDLEGNARRIIAALEQARSGGAAVVLFPEMALTGWPLGDLLLRGDFVEGAARALDRVLPHTRGVTAVIGAPYRAGGALWNGACIVRDGRVEGWAGKAALDPGSPFDEVRYFRPGPGPRTFSRGAFSFTVCVGADGWAFLPETNTGSGSAGAPAAEHPAVGHGAAGSPEAGVAGAILHAGAQPFVEGEGDARELGLAALARRLGRPVLSCNMVGGQDEVVFAGRSVACDGRGRVVGRARSFAEDVLFVDLALADPVPSDGAAEDRGVGARHGAGFHGETEQVTASARAPAPGPLDALYGALTLGLADYVRKNGFRDVVLGLSGGLDSALVAALAADALGPERVVGVAMPTRYSSAESMEDARRVAENLGIRYMEVDIDGIYQAFLDALAPGFQGRAPDVTEENLQPRIRGTLLMALSNKFGWLVLATGNKSETGVGYSTLYGDTVGGLAVLRDVPKTVVYDLARYRNGLPARGLIPRRVLEKPPSAELRPDQKDTDTLPDYPVLDPILRGFVEEGLSASDLVRRGHGPEAVQRVVRLVEGNEYKRRQGPPGVTVSPRAFGSDWRMPVTNRYRSQ